MELLPPPWKSTVQKPHLLPSLASDYQIPRWGRNTTDREMDTCLRRPGWVFECNATVVCFPRPGGRASLKASRPPRQNLVGFHCDGPLLMSPNYFIGYLLLVLLCLAGLCLPRSPFPLSSSLPLSPSLPLFQLLPAFSAVSVHSMSFTTKL